jgi:TetR/AcrR family transcriptional regulator, transcriptional repressor of aconitase
MIRTVPKVSDAHREQRREQILIAAWKCFARNGFHSTSMADVISEAGLSAGAVYLYFRSKEEIILAVAGQVFTGIAGRMAELFEREPPPSPAEVAGFLIEQPVLARAQTPGDLFPLLLAVWAEATRNPILADLADEILGALRQQITRLFERWESTGQDLRIPARDLAPVLVSLVQGFVTQQALVGNPSPETYRQSVVALFDAAGLGPAQPAG